MKRLIALSLLCLVLCGCGSQQAITTNPTTEATQPTTTAPTEPTQKLPSPPPRRPSPPPSPQSLNRHIGIPSTVKRWRSLY